MMSREPQPSSTAENSRFSMIAVTAIHQRRAKAVAKVGAMAVLSRREDYGRTGEHTRTEMVFLWRRKSRAERKNEGK